MAARVYLHIGLPKTATTYLQTILWNNRDALERQNVRLPGVKRSEHLWVSRIIREDPVVERSNKRQQGAWERLRADIAAWPGDAILSHEFFAAASSEQAHRMVADLAPAEVHLVVTGRDPLGIFTASWQESIKNRDTTPMAEYARYESGSSASIWNWRTLDLHRVLERWSPAFPSERVHVLPLPGREAARREIWDRFAQLIGVDPDSVDLTHGFPNASMGVVEAETLRRINAHLDAFTSSIDRGTYIRTFLADERLVPRGGDPYWPSEEQIEDSRRRGQAAVDYIVAKGFHVVGDLDALQVPSELSPRRRPDSVTEAEVAEVAVELSARLLHDVRDLRHERRALRRELAESQRELADSQAREDPGLRVSFARRWPLLRPVLLRGRHRPDSPP
jgi:hypothetical protein